MGAAFKERPSVEAEEKGKVEKLPSEGKQLGQQEKEETSSTRQVRE